MSRESVIDAEYVEITEEEFDPNPLLTKEEWRLVSRALLAYPETTFKLRRVAHIFLHQHKREF